MDSDARSDEELVLLLPHDAAAFEELFRRHRRAVQAFAVQHCLGAEDAADLVSATFLGLLESAHSFDPSRGRARAWLIGIANRQFQALQRREHKQWSVNRAIAGRKALGEDAMARLEEALDAARGCSEVERAIGTLPVQERELLWLVAGEGLSVEEAAQAFGVSEPVLRTRLWRARKALKAAMAQRGQGHPSPTATTTGGIR